MSKYSVTYACGHEGEIELFGKHSVREFRLEKEAEKNCPECWKKEQLKKAKASNQAGGLPELEGSEKQVNWAESIRAKMLLALNNEIADEEGWEDSDRTPAENLALKKAKASVEEFSKNSSAKWWIDNRFKDLWDLAQA